MKTQSNIKEQVILTPPLQYAAYLYRYTNLKDGKMYIGVHKGSVDDAYNHSSTNEEFQKVFVDSKSELKFEVLSYTQDYSEVLNQEHFALTDVDARNNELYYNKTNGRPTYEDKDLSKCNILLRQIETGVFPVTKEPIKDHVEMGTLQVRFQHDNELQKNIKQSIDDADGNTDNCNPVLVYERRGIDGKDMRGDGNHTVLGASASKHCIDIPAMRIPWDVCSVYTDSELRYVSRMMNKIPTVTKKPTTASDAIKGLLDDYYQNSIPVYARSNVDALKNYGFTRQVRETILKNAEQLIEVKNAKSQSGKLFKDYKANPHKQELDLKVTYYNNLTGMVAMPMSSSAFNIGRIFETLYAVKDICQNITIVVHHSTVAQGKAWKKTIQPNFINILEHCTKEEIDIDFVEMDMWMDDTQPALIEEEGDSDES